MNRVNFVANTARGGGIVAAAVLASYIIAFATQVSLARLLEPNVFGSLAFAITIAMFFDALTNWHGDKFVVFNKEDPQHAVNVAFTFELIAATFFAFLVIVVAPLLLRILGKGELTLYVQILAFAFFFNPLSRPRSLFEKELSFFRSKFPSVVAQIAAAALAISLAYKGFGIWSLLAWRLTGLVVETLILWWIAPYRPRLVWHPELTRDMIRFSWPLTASSFLVFYYYNVDYFIVGHFLPDSEEQLGYYWLGFQAGNYLLICRKVLVDVLFPIFAKMDDAKFKTQAFTLISHVTAASFLAPTLVIVFFARDIILCLWGSKWEPSVFPFQVIFITVLTRVISSNISYYLWDKGQTRPQMLMAALFSLLLTPVAYVATLRYGINGTAVSVLLVQVTVMFFTYEKYIKPATGHGTLFFFFWPWLLSLAAFLLSRFSEREGFGLSSRLALLTVLFLVAYVTVLRPAIQKFKLVMHSADKTDGGMGSSGIKPKGLLTGE